MTNAFIDLLELLPSSQKIHVTVAAHLGTQSQVTTNSGNSFMADGTSVAVGQKAWVQDGRITGAAPELVGYEVEV